MADVVTTIALKDSEFTGGLSRLESFVEAFKNRVAGSPASIKLAPTMGSQSLGGFNNFWSGGGGQALPPTSLQRFGAGLGAAQAEIGSAYGLASSAAKMVSEVGKYIDQLEYGSKLHLRWKKEIDAIGDSYLTVLNRNRALADPVRARSLGTFYGGADAAGQIGAAAVRNLEELGTFSSVWNTPRNVWNKGFEESTTGAYRQMNRVSQIAGREAWNQLQLDRSLDAERRKQEALDAMRAQLEAGRAAIDQNMKGFSDAADAKEKVELAERQLHFEDLLTEAQIRRLGGSEKEARLLEARVQYEERLAEITASAAGQDAKDVAIRRLGTANTLNIAAIEDAFRNQPVIGTRQFDMSAGGGSATMLASLTNRQQTTLEKIATGTEHNAQAITALSVALRQGVRAMWN